MDESGPGFRDVQVVFGAPKDPVLDGLFVPSLHEAHSGPRVVHPYRGTSGQDSAEEPVVRTVQRNQWSGHCRGTSGQHSITSGQHRGTSGQHRGTSGQHCRTSGQHSRTSGQHSRTSGQHSTEEPVVNTVEPVVNTVEPVVNTIKPPPVLGNQW